MVMRLRSITSTVPALFETATSAPQPECIRTPMAARFMSEVCPRMCYGEFISSFTLHCLRLVGSLPRVYYKSTIATNLLARQHELLLTPQLVKIIRLYHFLVPATVMVLAICNASAQMR